MENNVRVVCLSCSAEFTEEYIALPIEWCGRRIPQDQGGMMRILNKYADKKIRCKSCGCGGNFGVQLKRGSEEILKEGSTKKGG